MTPCPVIFTLSGGGNLDWPLLVAGFDGGPKNIVTFYRLWDEYLALRGIAPPRAAAAALRRHWQARRHRGA